VARRAARSRGVSGSRLPVALRLPGSSRMDIGVLAIVAVLAFVIPLMGAIAMIVGIALILIFVAYLWRASRVPDSGDEEFVGMAAHIADMPERRRRITVVSMFVGSATIILMSAAPFADALVDSGSLLGIDSYYLVQWLAPLASEAPEFIIAVLFALRGMGTAAIGTLIASKINQWTLLVGSLPIAHFFGGGGTALNLDARQVEEFVLTATQTVLGVAIIVGLRFHRWSALALVALFAVQFIVTDTSGRYVLSGIHLMIAVALLVVHRHHIVPTLAAPFRRSLPDPADPGHPVAETVRSTV
jgi:cation:H+ antiporter